MDVRPLGPDDRVRVATGWGEVVARRGELIGVVGLPGFAAVLAGADVGMVTYSVVDGACEVVTLEAFRPRIGVGRVLVHAVTDLARRTGCGSVWLVTTNDNLGAIAFYGAVGFSLVATRPGAVDDARRSIKPSIPPLGYGGVPIRDELEFRLDL